MVVQNDYLVAQHIFLDQRALGRVPPGSSQTFDVPPGAHTITSSDSTDPDDNPFSITEIFEQGYGYRYVIRPRRLP